MLGIRVRASLWAVKVDLTVVTSFFVDFDVFNGTGVHIVYIKCTRLDVLRSWLRPSLYLA